MDENYDAIIFDALTDLRAGRGYASCLIDHFSDEAFYNYVLTRAEYILRANPESRIRNEADRELVVFAISYIAIKKYGDGANKELWPYIRDEFRILYQEHHGQYGDNIIRNVLTDAQPSLSNYGYSLDMGNTVIGLPIALCGITKKWLRPFFDFSFDVYKHNLFRQDTDRDDVIQEFEDVFGSIVERNSLSLDGDFFTTASITYEVDGRTVVTKGKVYKLSHFTQSAIRKFASTQFLSEIGAKCVELISHYDNFEAVSEMPNYYKDAYEDWKKDYDARNERSGKKNSERHSQAHLVLGYVHGEDLVPMVTVPQRKISDKYSPDRLRIRITNQDGELLTTPIKPKVIDDETVGGYVVGADPIPIRRPFGGISFSIVCDDEVLYSKDLSRNIAFFDQNSINVYREIKPGNEFSGTLIVMSKPEPLEGLEVWKKHDFYWLSTKSVISTNVYKIGDEQYSFAKAMEPGLQGERNPFIDADVHGLGALVPVYFSVSSVVFEVDAVLLPSIELRIDNQRTESDIETLRKMENGIVCCQIAIPSLDRGLHKIVLAVCDKPLKSFPFYLDQHLSISFLKLGTQHLLKLGSSFGGYQEKFNLGQTKVAFDIAEDIKKPIKLIVRPNWPSFSIGDSDWYETDERFFFPTAKSNGGVLKVCGFLKPVMECLGQLLPPHLGEDGSWEFSINSLASYESSTNELLLSVREDNPAIGTKLVIHLDFTTYIPPETFEVFYDENNGKVLIRASFDDHGQISCDVLNEDGNIVLSEPLTTDVPLFADLPSRVNYTIRLSEEKGFGPFKMSKCLREKTLWFFKRDDLTALLLPIQRLVLEQKPEDEIFSDEEELQVFDWTLFGIEPTEYQNQYSAIVQQIIKNDEGDRIDSVRLRATAIIQSSTENGAIRAEIVSYGDAEFFQYDTYNKRLLPPKTKEIDEETLLIKAIIIDL